MYETIRPFVEHHERWRASCLNLIPSENSASAAVRELLASDFGNRYTLPFRDGTIGGQRIDNAYRGTRYLDLVEREGCAIAKAVYQSEYASLRPLGGHIAAMLALTTLAKRGDTIGIIPWRMGGYDGYGGDYLPQMLGLRTIELPFAERRWGVDAQATAGLIEDHTPTLVVLGQSYFPFPYDLAPIVKAAASAGTSVVYDGSHVMGLIGGNEFQHPLAEGCTVLLGSTHKTLFGPQGGILLSNRGAELGPRFEDNTTWRTIDNAHWNRIAALTEALLELQNYGCAYARAVVTNARALAHALDECGVPMRFASEGYTESHQVLFDQPALEERMGADIVTLSARLEKQQLIIDAVGRAGVNEVTRLGMKPAEMGEIAHLIHDAMRGQDVRTRVEALRAGRTLHYCFANP